MVLVFLETIADKIQFILHLMPPGKVVTFLMRKLDEAVMSHSRISSLCMVS